MASIKKLFMNITPMYTGSVNVVEYDPKIVSRLTIQTRYDDKVELFHKLGKNKIGIPWFLSPMSKDDDRRQDGEPIKFDCLMVPRNEEQARIIDESCDLLNTGQSHIVQASTGFGKTACAAAVVADIGVKTLIVVPKEDLIKQWRKELKKFLGLKDSEIGEIRQNKIDVIGKKVVIGMLKSLSLDGRYPGWIRKQFGFVIFDEVHRLGAETFSKVAYYFPSRLRMGLSASPDRSDGKEIIFNVHIGPVLVIAELIPMVPKILQYQSNWQCPRVPRKNKQGIVKIVRMPHSGAKAGAVLKRLVHDTERNRLLATLILTAYSKGRRVLFFTHSLDHIDTIENFLRAAGVPGKDIAHYKGGMKEHERDIAKGKPVILATYGMMKEGTDIPWLDACVLGTPMSDIRQAVGRVLREYPDKKQPVIFDIKDDDSPVFKGFARKRREYYAKIGAKVKTMSVRS